MILEDVQGKFVNWANIKNFSGLFKGLEEIDVRGEHKQMAVFEIEKETYYIGNFQIMRILKHNLEKVIDKEVKITVIGTIITKSGNNMLEFQIETVDPLESTSRPSTANTEDIPF